MVKMFYIENRKKGDLLNFVDTWKDGEEIRGTMLYSKEIGFHIESKRGRMTVSAIIPKGLSEEVAAWFDSCIGEEFAAKCISFKDSEFTIEKV